MAGPVAFEPIPIKIVGWSNFGLYPYINNEHTYNMYVSGDALVQFSGYKNVKQLLTNGKGRGLFRCVRGKFLIGVWGPSVFRINFVENSAIFLFNIGSNEGRVFFADNRNSQVAIVGGGECWIYNYETGLFGKPTLSPDLIPNYVRYQNNQFLFGNANTGAGGANWFVYGAGSAFSLTFVAQLPIEGDPDTALAVIPIPGGSKNVLVFGSTIAEIWSNVGGLKVYSKNTSVSIDYGCISVSTIASNERMICWLGQNADSAPVMMMMQGGVAERISTDGIDFELDALTAPEDSTASFYRVNGHLFYVLTFYTDNVTYAYDFNVKKFVEPRDHDFGYFPAVQFVYFRGQTYFPSNKDANLYEIGADLNTFKVDDDHIYDIPRIRICPTVELPSGAPYVVKSLSFRSECGTDASHAAQGEEPCIDMTISENGGQTFGNVVRYKMPTVGHYSSYPFFTRLGRLNRFTPQFRCWGSWRFILRDGIAEVEA